MALPDYTTQSGSTYKANIDGTLANISDGTNVDTAAGTFSGNVSIGGALTVTGGDMVQERDGGFAELYLRGYRDSHPQALINAQNARGSKATPAAMQINDSLFRGVYQAHDGTSFSTAAWFEAVVDGAVSTGIVPGRLRWMTVDSGGSLTEGMRLDSAQNLRLNGAAAPASAQAAFVQKTGTAPTGSVTDAYIWYSSDRSGAGSAWPTGRAEDGTTGFVPLLTDAEVSQLEGIGTDSLALLAATQDMANKTIITKGDNNNGANTVTDSSPSLGCIYIAGNGGILGDHKPGANTALFWVYSDGAALQVTKIAGDTNTTASVTGGGTTITFTVGDAATAAYAVLQIGA